MKKSASLLTIASLCLMAVSCISFPKPAYEATVGYINYANITNKTGVFITEATSLSQSYEGLGSLMVFVQDGYELTYTKQKNDTTYDSIYGTEVKKNKAKAKYGDYKYATMSDAVTLAANKAKMMGANGIINLKIKLVPGERTAYNVTGMAVKIAR